MGEETKIQWCDHTFNPWIAERDARMAEECMRLASKPVDEINAWRERLEKLEKRSNVLATIEHTLGLDLTEAMGAPGLGAHGARAFRRLAALDGVEP